MRVGCDRVEDGARASGAVHADEHRFCRTRLKHAVEDVGDVVMTSTFRSALADSASPAWQVINSNLPCCSNSRPVAAPPDPIGVMREQRLVPFDADCELGVTDHGVT